MWDLRWSCGLIEFRTNWKTRDRIWNKAWGTNCLYHRIEKSQSESSNHRHHAEQCLQSTKPRRKSVNENIVSKVYNWDLNKQTNKTIIGCWLKMIACKKNTSISKFFRTVIVKFAQSYPTLCNPMDYTGHGILQARILEWVALPFSRHLPNPGVKPRSPALQAVTGWSLPAEPQRKLTRISGSFRFVAE